MDERSRGVVSAALAAALAWLLVQPPVLPGGVIGAGTPIEQWTVLGRFDSREACEKKRSDSNAALISTLAEYAPDQGARQQQVEIAVASRCTRVPDADPDSP